MSAAYGVALVVGLLSLPSPEQPIGDPIFSLLEILILLMTPLLVGLLVAIHAWASEELKVFSLMALVFTSVVALLTSSVHFVIFAVSRQPEFAEVPWMSRLLSFRWPSVAYALDILAWDVFFALAVLFAAPVFRGDRLATLIRVLLIASGALSLAGLSGVVAGNMRLRNIGIVGYVGVFPLAALLVAVLFRRSRSA